MAVLEAKTALDAVIRKSRVHFYKPIQIAEILYRNRLADLNLDSVDNYRTRSKRWRDEVSLRLVGNASSSSSRYQDNVFEENAVPPRHIASLGEFNRKTNGAVEAYIYLSMALKMSDLQDIHAYLNRAENQNFNLSELLELFSNNAGLTRSMDKVYEIVAYSLFAAIIEALEVSIKVSVDSTNEQLVEDFSDFTSKVVGISSGTIRSETANVFRVGATNANDGGLDLWANFGPAIQVKHFSIGPEDLQAITNGVQAAKFIVVCTDADKEIIKSILIQAGTYAKVQSVVTLSDLRAWYERAFSDQYFSIIGKKLLELLLTEFEYEFPAIQELPKFIEQRDYSEQSLPDGWSLQ